MFKYPEHIAHLCIIEGMFNIGSEQKLVAVYARYSFMLFVKVFFFWCFIQLATLALSLHIYGACVFRLSRRYNGLKISKL